MAVRELVVDSRFVCIYLDSAVPDNVINHLAYEYIAETMSLERFLMRFEQQMAELYGPSGS